MASVLAHLPRLPFSLDPLIAEAKRRARRRRGLIILAVLVAAGAAVALRELPSAPRHSGAAPLPQSAVLRVGWQARLGRFPVVAEGDHAVWAASVAPPQVTHGRLVRFDPRSGKRIASVPVGWWPAEIAVGAGGVWVADTAGDGSRVKNHMPGLAGAVTRIDPRTNRVVATIRLPGVQRVAVGGGAAWVTSTTTAQTGEAISEISRAGNRVTLVRRLPGVSGPLAWGEGRLWALTWLAGPSERARIWEIDPKSGRILGQVVVPGAGPNVALAYRSGVLWLGAVNSAPGSKRGLVYRIRVGHGLSLGHARLVAGATNLAATPGGVWVAGGSSLLLLNPTTDRPKARLDLPGWISTTPNVLAASGREAWVITQTATPTDTISHLVSVRSARKRGR